MEQWWSEDQERQVCHRRPGRQARAQQRKPLSRHELRLRGGRRSGGGRHRAASRARNERRRTCEKGRSAGSRSARPLLCSRLHVVAARLRAVRAQFRSRAAPRSRFARRRGGPSGAESADTARQPAMAESRRARARPALRPAGRQKPAAAVSFGRGDAALSGGVAGSISCALPVCREPATSSWYKRSRRAAPRTPALSAGGSSVSCACASCAGRLVSRLRLLAAGDDVAAGEGVRDRGRALGERCRAP